ncbi:hypothetical protein [Tunicatimonas pelagia]|uniref:hypothetical protein n=1 Tax=Tunicatimonas pelagia TaxID=931531 RepID=UPI0026666A0D|nr:hypothetical protein [Tunicatimonas pelagia]WKN42915.1 hypothetical protein P0M28_28155 [Tunicatimonas pelagia]
MKLTLRALIFCLVGLFACEESADEAINTLGTEVDVEMKEYLEGDQRLLMFKFFTTRDFGCINHRIDYNLQQQTDGLAIHLNEVEEPTACLKAMGPASAFVDVGALNIGEYEFSLHIGEAITNTGVLTVNPESYQLVLNAEAGMNLETIQLQRIPKNALWGSIRFLNKPSDNIANSFVAQLAKLGATQDKFEKGDYGFFEVDASGKVSPKTVTGDASPFTFLMNYRGDEAELVALLSEINRNYGDEVNIRMRTAQGNEYRSWDLY